MQLTVFSLCAKYYEMEQQQTAINMYRVKSIFHNKYV